MLSFFLTRSEPGVSGEPDADVLVHIDSTSNEVSDTMPAGRAASAVAVGDGFVWVANAGDGNVWRVDPRTRAVIKIPTRGSPVDVAVGRGEVLVANGPEHSLTAIDARTGEFRFTSTLGAAYSVGSLRVVGDDGGVWFADPTTNLVGKESAGLQGGFLATQIAIPPDGSKVARAYEDFADFSVGQGALWVAGDTLGRTLWKLDPRGRKLVATVRLPFIPAGVAAGEGAVWVTSLLDDTVTRLNPSTNRIVRTIRVGRGAGSVATGNGAVWVVNGIDGTVSRVDPRANRVVATIPIGNMPGDIAVGPDGPWVTATDAAPAAVPEGSIPIGVLSDCRGSYSQTRASTLAGAELALIERGGTRAGTALTDGVEGVSIAGHPVTLYFGCSDSTTGSALSEARRLVDGIGVRVLIGPLRGTQGLALQDFARRRPGVAFVNGTSSVLLQHPAPNFFSFHTDGAGWTAGLGTYAYRTLGWRRAVVVADLEDDLFNWTQVAGFVAEFCSLGGSVAKRVWVPAGIRDYSSVVSELPKSGVDGFSWPRTRNDRGPGESLSRARRRHLKTAHPRHLRRRRGSRAARRPYKGDGGRCSRWGRRLGRVPASAPPCLPGAQRRPRKLLRHLLPRRDGRDSRGAYGRPRRRFGRRAPVQVRARAGQADLGVGSDPAR